MSDKELLKQMLSMLPEEFQDIYDDTIPEVKEIRKKMGKKQNVKLQRSVQKSGEKKKLSGNEQK